jgi:hypothetical protein
MSIWIDGFREKRLNGSIGVGLRTGIFVSTGDLVDGQMDNLSALAGILREIRTRYGKYAGTGNHEFYAGLERSLDFTKKAGFTLLRDEGLTIAGLINIAGVDDPAGKRPELDGSVSEKELLSRFPRELFTLVLTRVVDPKVRGHFDLRFRNYAPRSDFSFYVVIKLLIRGRGSWFVSGRFFPVY